MAVTLEEQAAIVVVAAVVVALLDLLMGTGIFLLAAFLIISELDCFRFLLVAEGTAAATTAAGVALVDANGAPPAAMLTADAAALAPL